MRQHLIAAALSLFVLAGSALAQPTATPPAQGLGLAARFVPPDTDIAYLTDWSRLLADMRTAYPAPPQVGDSAFLRRMGERHALVTRFAIGNATPWWMHEQWGWSFLDLDWELDLFPGMAVAAFGQGFDPAPLLALIDERGFGTGDHHGQLTRHHPFDLSLAWLRPPLAAYQNLAYLEQERVLLAANTTLGLHALLDAHAGRSTPWPAGDLLLSLAQAAEPPTGAWVFPASAVCERLPSAEPDLQAYQAAAVAYRHVGDGPHGTVLLGYDDAASAGLDLQPRTRLSGEGGETFGPGQFYRLSAAEADDGLLWLHLGPLDRPSRLFDLLIRSDVPFLACPS